MIIIRGLRDHNPAYLQGMNINSHIEVETGSHGENWNALHEGYFSNYYMAEPLLKTIIQHLENSNPDVLIDLGGGTGFILSQLADEKVLQGTTLINMDFSDDQLAASITPSIKCINGSIDSFLRNNLVPNNQKVFFIMRSALHYTDKSGLLPALTHIHSQMNSGEIFIHQTACFKDVTEQNCINALYQKMRTQKWYPSINELSGTIKDAGFEIIKTHNASSLVMTAPELAERYQLSDEDISNIKNELLNNFGEIKNILKSTPEGFTAHLPYQVFVTQAK